MNMKASSFPYIIVWVANANERELAYVIDRQTKLSKSEWFLVLGKSVCYKTRKEVSLSHDTLPGIYTQNWVSRMEIHIIEKHGLVICCPFRSFIWSLLNECIHEGRMPLFRQFRLHNIYVIRRVPLCPFTAEPSACYYLRKCNQNSMEQSPNEYKRHWKQQYTIKLYFQICGESIENFPKL